MTPTTGSAALSSDTSNQALKLEVRAVEPLLQNLGVDTNCHCLSGQSVGDKNQRTGAPAQDVLQEVNTMCNVAGQLELLELSHSNLGYLHLLVHARCLSDGRLLMVSSRELARRQELRHTQVARAVVKGTSTNGPACWVPHPENTHHNGG
jgi:hypothetical protein